MAGLHAQGFFHPSKMGSPTQIFIAVIKITTKWSLERKEFISSHMSLSLSVMKDNRERTWGPTWRQELMEKPLRGASYWLAPPDCYFSTTPDHLPKGSTTHTGQRPPISMGKYPIDLVTGQCDGGIFSVEAPLSR